MLWSIRTAKTECMKKILLCEEEDVMVTAIEFRLQKIGCQVTRAKSGDVARQILDMNVPDLAIISLNLANNGGMELIKWIRAEKGANLPVVIISELEQEQEVMDAYDAGANDFITKPFKPTELVLRVMHLLDKYDA